jgi:hypothetical protein
MPTSELPAKFKISLNKAKLAAITDAELNKIGRSTGAKVLVDIIKADIKKNRIGGIGPISTHYKGEWSYTT